jgi:hypothetical protein
MTQRIEVPGVGIVEFPDSMSDDQITQAIKTNIIPQYSGSKNAATQAGRTAAGFVDVIPNMASSMLNAATYAGARAFQQSVPEATALANKVTQPFMNPMGRLTGVENTPEYQNEMTGRVVGAIGEGLTAVARPVVRAVAPNTTPDADIENMAGSLTMFAPGIAKKAVPVAKALPDVARGAYGRATGNTALPGVEPQVWQQRSARQPVTESYIPDPSIQAWKQGEIPTAQAKANAQPWTAEQIAALRKTQGNVPFKGQVNRAIGEQLIEPYTNWKGYLPDIALGLGGTMLGVGPYVGPALNVARKIVGTTNAVRTAGAMNKLGDVGLTPLYQQELQALKTGQEHPSYIGPTTGPQVPPPGPAPMGGAPSMAAQTPAAQAAAATTQAKVQQTTGAAVPSGPSYNVPTQTVPQPNFGGVKQAQQQSTMAMPKTGPAVPMPMEPMAAPITTPQYTGYKVAEAPTLTKVQKQLEPTANTPLIEKALADKIAANPQLTEFNKPYITPENLKEPIGKFLSNETRNIVAEGGPGTGKTSLGIEWKRQNQNGHLVKITANSLKDAKTLDTILEKLKTQANDKVLFLIDEADTFTNPGKSTALKHLNTLKEQAESYGPAVKFLYTTNKVDKMPALAKDVPVVKVDTKLTPQERSTYALKVAQDFNVNKTPAEIEAIANNPNLTNFRDVRNAVSEGYSLKEPPIFTYDKTAAKAMPNTPEKLTQVLDAFVNNETSRNVIIFDASAYAKDPKLAMNLQKYVPKNSSEFVLNDLSKNLLEGNTAGGKPIRIVINKNNIDDVRALKSEFETGNEKLHPLNIILEDPTNLLIGKDNLPLRSRAHIIDGSYWNNAKPAVDAKTVDVAKAIQRGESLGIVKSPKTEPVVFKGKTYNTGAEMRKDLIKQKISAYDIDKLMNKYFPGE